jgi:hypothetical protein
MAEVEIGILSRQCLNRRIAGIGEMSDEVAAWVPDEIAGKPRYGGSSPLPMPGLNFNTYIRKFRLRGVLVFGHSVYGSQQFFHF